MNLLHCIYNNPNFIFTSQWVTLNELDCSIQKQLSLLLKWSKSVIFFCFYEYVCVCVCLSVCLSVCLFILENVLSQYTINSITTFKNKVLPMKNLNWKCLKLSYNEQYYKIWKIKSCQWKLFMLICYLLIYV